MTGRKKGELGIGKKASREETPAI